MPERFFSADEPDMTDAEFESFLDSVEAAGLAEPAPEIKDRVLAEVGAMGEAEVEADAESDAEVVELRPRRWRWAGAAAAAALLVVVGGIAVVPGVREQNVQVAETAGEKEMHAIMAAADLTRGSADASGASLDIVSSAAMDKSGAMVDGQPELEAGMGAQVWTVGADGSVTSAGVIGQDPHDGVWMPFEGDTVKVMVTEEPAGGSTTPTGKTLAEVELQPADA